MMGVVENELVTNRGHIMQQNSIEFRTSFKFWQNLTLISSMYGGSTLASFFFLCTYLIQQEYKLIQEQNDTTGSNINVIPSGHYIDGAIHTKSEFAKSLCS